MTKAMMLAIVFASSTPAFATNLTGTWTGSGSAVNNGGQTINCESVTLTISQTASTFSVNSAFTCDGTAINVPGGTMQIKGADLYDNGTKAGSITGSSVSVTAHAKPYTMKSDADFNDSTMRLHSVIFVGNGTAPALTFDAKSLRRN
jgi:hypothetical protein